MERDEKRCETDVETRFNVETDKERQKKEQKSKPDAETCPQHEICVFFKKKFFLPFVFLLQNLSQRFHQFCASHICFKRINCFTRTLESVRIIPIQNQKYKLQTHANTKEIPRQIQIQTQVQIQTQIQNIANTNTNYKYKYTTTAYVTDCPNKLV